MAMKQPPDNPPAEWFVEQFDCPRPLLRITDFRLTNEDVAFLVKKLTTEGLYKDPNGKGEFTFTLLKAAIKYLHKNKLDTSKLADSIKELKRPAEKKAIEALQFVIDSLTPSGTIPFEVSINGEYDEKTEHAVNFLVNAYKLHQSEPDEKLIAQLQEISLRVIRLFCDDADALAFVPYDPFCFISSRDNKFKILLNQKAVVISRIQDNMILAELPGIVSRNNTQIALYHVFCKWFMLLQLEQPKTDYAHLFQLPANSYDQSISQGERFLTNTNIIFELSADEKIIPVHYTDDAARHMYFVAIAFSDDMRMKFIKPQLPMLPDTDMLFSLGNFYNAKPNPDRAAVIKGNAKILKICVISEKLKNIIEEISDDDAFYELIAASDSDLIAIVNIGLVNLVTQVLSIQPKMIEGEFLHQVLSAAASLSEFTPPSLYPRYSIDVSQDKLIIKEAIGQPGPPEYYPYTIGFRDRNFALLILRSPQRLYNWLQLLRRKSTLQTPEATYDLTLYINYVAGDYSDDAFLELDSIEEILNMNYSHLNGKLFQPAFKLRIKNTGRVRLFVHAVYLEYDLAIGTSYFPALRLDPGQSGLLNINEEDNLSDVIKLRLNRVYQEMKVEEIMEYMKLIITPEKIALSELEQPGIVVRGERAEIVPIQNLPDELPLNADVKTLAFNIRRTIIESPSPNIKLNEFREHVKHLYANKKIVVRDDLQKNRWGAKSKANGKRLTASVKQLSRELFRVELMVAPENAAYEIKGHVAFFLHDTFDEEIEFIAVKQGVARLDVEASEAFTVAAYTADNTMLELDLNQVKGFPEDFYYVDPGETFENEVKKQLATRPVTVKTDQQKNRWGSKATNNNIVLSATVKKVRSRNFTVKLSVESNDQAHPLQGFVAFFLHETYEDPIEYAAAKNGKASLEITATDGFTVGALTEDGTLLELDLNEVKGFPRDFYSKK